MMESKEFKTIINGKPAKQGNYYHFTIPIEMIKKGIIDPDKFYELRIFVFDDSKQ